MPEDSASTKPAETRRLAAIMFTDIVGFSRQMGSDEARMLRLLDVHNHLIQQAVAEHHGTGIKTVGDAFLVDFPSVVHAVQCAQQIQTQLRAYNAEKEPGEQIHVRIGIHLGDVVQKDGDVFGDGVNIASRLQGLAKPGTICISDVVYRDVAKKLDLGIVVSLGKPTLKNIADRFSVYALLPDAPHGMRQTLRVQRLKLSRRIGTAHRVAAVMVVLALVSVGAIVVRERYFSAPPGLPLPDKPSIVVLPFSNMSNDPEQEYFSDGITEDLTSDLSKISNLFVIARNSAFTYKGKAVKVQDVSREMVVRYVLEGSVRRANDQVRITAQLVDAATDSPLWAERYDRPLTDIFALQDEIVQKIVTTLKLQLTVQEQGYIVRKHTDNLEAYDYLLRGIAPFFRDTPETNVQARQLWEKAVALDSQYAEAYAWLSWTYYREWIFRWSTDPQSLERAVALAQQAVALDDSLPRAHALLSMFYTQTQQYDQAIAEGERAVALDPNNADSYSMRAAMLNLAGRPEEALRMSEQAIRLNPHSPPVYLNIVGWSYYYTGRYAEAIATMKDVISRSPTFLGAYPILTLAYVDQWSAQQTSDAQALTQAAAAAQRLVALHDSYDMGHQAVGSVALWQKQYARALAEMERAIALGPNLADGYADLAEVLSRVSRPEEALRMAEQALRHKPFVVDWHLNFIGTAYHLAGQPQQAIAALKQYLSRYPNILSAHLTLAAVYSELGKEAEAQAEAAEVLRINPKFSLEIHKQRAPIKDPATLERHISALRQAGLK
jgi:adenylate cyclase